MNKLEKIGYYNTETGEEIDSDTAENIQKEENKKQWKTNSTM
jgi:hypothetical protein